MLSTKPVRHTLDVMSRYTKTDMTYVASGGFWSGVGIVISSLIAFATATAFANLLPKETYGAYQYVISIVAFLGILTLPGTKTAVSYAAAHDSDGSALDAIKRKIRWSTLATLACFGIALYYAIKQNPMLAGAFAVVGVFMPWWESYGIYVAYLQGKKRFQMSTLYEAVIQVLNAAAIILVIAFTDNVVLLCFAFFGSYTIGRFFFFKRALKRVPPNDVRDPEVGSYGNHLSVMNITGVLANTLDKFLLWQFLGPVALAVYTFALMVPQRGVSMLSSINRLYFPKAAERSLEEIRHTVFKRIGLLSLFSITGALAYIVIAPFLFNTFFPQYHDAVPYTQLAAILIAIQPFTLISTALGAHAKKKELYAITSIPPFVQILLLPLLVPSLGILGAIVVLIIGQLLESLISTILLLRASKDPEPLIVA